MRVFWPTDIREEGTALGWELGDALIVAAVVDLASVAPPAGVDRLGLVTTDPETQAYGLVIRVDGDFRPIAYSQRATTVLYTPPQVSRHQVLSIADSTRQPYAPETSTTLPAILELINRVEGARAALGLAEQSSRATLDLGALALVPLAFALASTRRLPRSAGEWIPLASRVALVAAARVASPRVWLPRAVPALLASTLSSSVRVLGVRLSLDRTAFFGNIQRRAATVIALPETEGTTAERAAAHLAAEDSALAILYDHLFGALATLGALYYLASHTITWSPSPALLADPVVAALEWLNDWPFGLKLNTPLSQGFCSAFTVLLLAWRDRAVPLLASAPHILLIALLVTAPFLGLSSALALASDAITLVTLHLRLCYLVTAALCRWQLSALRGLWDLFRVKRWNVLRHRTDSYTYETDTLFLGTLFFMLSAFLAPTVLAYGGLFAAINYAIGIVQRGLGAAIARLDTLPYRIAHPRSVAGGVVFDLVPLADGYVLELKSTPAS